MAGLSQENKFRDVFNEKGIGNLANRIYKNYPKLNKKKFVEECIENFESMSFMDRSNQICAILYKHLPKEFPDAIDILLKSQEAPLPEPGKTDWDSFIYIPQCQYVSRYGKEYYDLSMNALYELTQRCSAESELRTFVEIHPEKTLGILRKWARDQSDHVRRLVSEGTRPRLPLAGRIVRFQKNPKPVIELLELLKDDPSLYVRRSVANNLNDISKDHPELVIEVLNSWKKGASKERLWILQHATRGLIKQGHTGALQLLDVHTDAKIKLSEFSLDKKKVKIGSELPFSFWIESKEDKTVSVVIDYRIHFVKANGETKPKVFKLRKIKLQCNSKIKIETKFKARETSGRKLYTGEHKIEIQVNGKMLAENLFMLT